MTICNLLVQRGPSKSMSWCKSASSVKYCENVFTGSYSEQKAATDPIGDTTVTFSGVNAGSEIRVYLSDGTEVAGIENCATDQTLAWPVYAGGSSNNTVRVVVVNTAYKIKEFTYTVSLGNQSLPIQQEADKWYSNP